jgi:hypothetical protein
MTYINEQTTKNLLISVILCLGIFSLLLCKKDYYLEPFILPKTEPTTSTVWTYWEPYPPPSVVKMCYDNWKRIGKLTDIRILHPGNITEYIPQKELLRINNNAENPAVKSDFILFYLLHKFGGTWIDGSVFLNKPLFDWLPKDKFFCYRADRFSTDITCMETFFMYSPLHHPLPGKWYQTLHEVAETVGKDKFVENVSQKYPNINESMSEDNYLWVYIVGKFLLLNNPEFTNMITTYSAEEGPWFEAERQGWENVDQICKALAKKEPCKNCPITKIHNGMREKCGIEVIP